MAVSAVNTQRNSERLHKGVILSAGSGIAAMVICVLPAACGPGLLVTPPSPAQLQIRGTTLLMPGSSGRLTAWLSDKGTMREVHATWTAEGDAISLTGDGTVRARQTGSAIVTARYEDHVGTETVHVVTNVAGTWRGSITVVECWHERETVPDPCERRRDLTAPLVVTLTQRATAENDSYSNLTASVEVFTPPLTGNFVGAVDSQQVFLDGNLERADLSAGGVRFRWRLEDGRLLPFSPDSNDEFMHVTFALPGNISITETWQLSPMTR